MSEALRIMLKNIGQLSTKEKALAAHCLLTAMDCSTEDDIDASWLQLAESRSAELESGRVKGVFWEDIKKDLLGQMLPVIFHPATQEEIKQSFDWYQEQSLGLGSEFIDELEESIASIRTLPSAWNKMGVGHRRFVLSRFPYSVIYKIVENKLIHIVAVMHNNRKPGYWPNRGEALQLCNPQKNTEVLSREFHDDM